MTTVNLKTIGGKEIEFNMDVNKLADYLELSNTGDEVATKEMVSFISQDIVDKFEIKAIMDFGGIKFLTFNNFKISEVLNAFDASL